MLNLLDSPAPVHAPPGSARARILALPPVCVPADLDMTGDSGQPRMARRFRHEMRRLWSELRGSRDLLVWHTGLVSNFPARSLPPTAQQEYHSRVMTRVRGLAAISEACRRRRLVLDGEQLAALQQYLEVVESLRRALDG